MASARVAGFGPNPSLRISSTACLFQSVTTSACALSGRALSAAKAVSAKVRRMHDGLFRPRSRRKTYVSFRRGGPKGSADADQEAAKRLTAPRVANHGPNPELARRLWGGPRGPGRSLCELVFFSACDGILEVARCGEPGHPDRFMARLDGTRFRIE